MRRGTFGACTIPRMIAYPHAKINLGLNVIGKRADGYHDIESVMVPIPLHDALEVVMNPEAPQGWVSYTRSGLPVDGPLKSDLVMRAHALLSSEHRLPGLRVHLHKAIPLGAGLGGGSSNGAFALSLINQVAGLGLRRSGLTELAAVLGSDCPFFVSDGPQLARGRGEVLTPIELDLAGLWIVLVNPGVHVATSLAYAHAEMSGRELGLAQLLRHEPVERWREAAPNLMEPYVFRTWPEVAEAYARLRHAGAAHAAMSGSGSTVFGIFRSKPPMLEWPSRHKSWTLSLG